MHSKFDVLKRIAGRKIAIALSGGVDSSTLAALYKKWADVLAITAITPFTSRRDVKNARRAAREVNIPHITIEVNLPPEVFENTSERCYICKKAIMKCIKEEARRRGFLVVADGTNLDDLNEQRPGLRALKEEDIISPWAEAGFTKEEIRQIAKNLGLSFHNKPSNSCLATRISGRIDFETLKKVERAEELILDLVGERRVRVRVSDDKAGVEIERIEELRIEELVTAIRKMFTDVEFLPTTNQKPFSLWG